MRRDRLTCHRMKSVKASTLLLTALILVTSAAWPQNLDKEVVRLEQLQLQASELEQQQSLYEVDLKSLLRSLDELEDRPLPARAELAEARMQLEQARTARDLDPSDTNMARVQNAEFRLALSEHRFSKANREATALQQRIAALESRLQANQLSLTSTREQIRAQQVLVRQLQQQRLSAEHQSREQQLERQRAETAAAQQEVLRLRALLEVQEQTVAAHSESGAQPTAEPTEAATGGSKLILLTERQDVLALLTAVHHSLDTSDPRRVLVNRILHIKRGDDSRAHTLKALSTEQYRTEAQLEAGLNVLVIGFHQWEVDVPSTGHYVFFYDLNDSAAPQLRMYSKQLES